MDRAGSLTGLKGYVTSISTQVIDGEAVIAAYQDLYQVERSFRMAKSDLKARPIFTAPATPSKPTSPSCSRP